MALFPRLLKDGSLNTFAFGTTDSTMTNSATQGNIALAGGVSYYSWATLAGMSPADIGGGNESATTMCSFVINTETTTAETPYNVYANGLPNGTNTFQQPITYDPLVHSPTDVVWAIYLPQPDGTPTGGIGHIQAYSTVVDSAASVGGDDPDEATAKEALTNLLARLGDRWASFAGPNFTGNPSTDLFGPSGAIAMGAFITYSNIHDTWIVYAG